jgi:hypothetical protein
MITMSSTYPQALNPRSFVVTKSISTTKFHKRGDKLHPADILLQL